MFLVQLLLELMFFIAIAVVTSNMDDQAMVASLPHEHLFTELQLNIVVSHMHSNPVSISVSLSLAKKCNSVSSILFLPGPTRGTMASSLFPLGNLLLKRWFPRDWSKFVKRQGDEARKRAQRS